MTALISGASFAAPLTPRTPCCGVLAVANFAEVSYERAWAALLPYVARPGSWRGRTYDSHREKALRDLGVKFFKLAAYNKMTVGAFVRDYAVHHTHYKVMVSGHVLHVHNGVITDQGDVGGWDNHKCRRCRIIEVWERVT